MATAATQVQDTVDNIHGMQSQLAGYHSSLQGSWQGEASNAFTMAYQRFNEDFTKVLQALQGIQERLVGTHSRYAATEQANTQISTKISSALNR
jgi:WXG100 family type VII secretion target